MCPTPLGRIHSRVATVILLPALLGLILSLITMDASWIVFIAVFLLIGVTLDAAVYSWLIRYQPPWLTVVLAFFEFGLVLLVGAGLLKLNTDLIGGVPDIVEAIVFFWVAWALAAITKIVLLPLLSLTYLESAGEFRRAEWSVPAEQASFPVLAMPEGQPGALVERASGVHAKPLPRQPSPSGVHEVPAAMQARQ